jgi:hypothetical protein
MGDAIPNDAFQVANDLGWTTIQITIYNAEHSIALAGVCTTSRDLGECFTFVMGRWVRRMAFRAALNSRLEWRLGLAISQGVVRRQADRPPLRCLTAISAAL